MTTTDITTHDELLGIHNPDTIQPGDVIRRSSWMDGETFRVIATAPTMVFGVDQDGLDYALQLHNVNWRWIKLS